MMTEMIGKGLRWKIAAVAVVVVIVALAFLGGRHTRPLEQAAADLAALAAQQSQQRYERVIDAQNAKVAELNASLEASRARAADLNRRIAAAEEAIHHVTTPVGSQEILARFDRLGYRGAVGGACGR